jgi:flagellar biosynthesis protein FliR
MNGLLANPALWALTQTKVLLWMMVMVRLTGLMALLPGFGQGRIPVPVRAALIVLMALVISPVIPPPTHLPTGIWDLAGLMVIEFASGLLIGLSVAWIVDAVSFAGHLMDFQMGFAFVQFMDPVSAQPVSISGTVLTQVTVLFLFTSGLYHQMILALVQSFTILPIGHGLQGPPLDVVVLVGQIMVRGFQLSFPVLFALFFVDVLEGISAKFMPQLQLIQLSFPIKITIGLSVLGFILNEFLGWLEPLLQMAPRVALRMLR